MNDKMLYHRLLHPHAPRNPNDIHAREQKEAGVNQRIAVSLTRAVSTMSTAYIFTVLALIGLFGLFGWLNPFVFLLATWVSQQFLQLVFLPILAVGQSVLGRKAEIQAEQMFLNTQRTLHDIEEVLKHLSAQDEELLKQTRYLQQILDKSQTRRST